jgi:16S rRNA processing protein RimM
VCTGLDYGPYYDRAGLIVLDQFRLIEAQKLIVSAAPWPSREAVIKAKGFEFYAPRSRFKAPEDEDDFYIVDLLGLKVKDPSGEIIGQIKAIDNFGAGDLLLLRLSGRPEIYIPFTRNFVPEVHLNDGHIVADLSGFTEDNPS